MTYPKYPVHILIEMLREPCGEADCGHCELERQAADEIERLQAENKSLLEQGAMWEGKALMAEATVGRLPKTADGVPVVQMQCQDVWRPEGPEGLPQRQEYYRSGCAVFRGTTHDEMMLIRDCYSTLEAAEAARKER